MTSATAAASLQLGNSQTFIGSCKATTSGTLFRREQSSVGPDRGVPVMSTLRMALTTITAEAGQGTGQVRSRSASRSVLPKLVHPFQQGVEARAFRFERMLRRC